MTKLCLTGVKELSSRESRYQLQRIYKKILRLLEKMPEKAAYRINTEQIVCYRLSVVENFEGKEEIENNICCGRAEMLLSQAKDEYKLACKMIIWKPWESLTQFAPPGQWKWP